MALYSCESCFRGSVLECNYFHVFKESFSLEREAILLTERAVLEGKGAVDSHLIWQISLINLVIREYYVSV